MPRPKGGKKKTEILTSHNLLNPDVMTFTLFEVEGDEPVVKYEQSSPYRVGLDHDEKFQIDIITQADKEDEGGTLEVLAL